MLKKEASYFGDIVILPFMDRYELVVLKTIAICEFGVSLYLTIYFSFILIFFYQISFQILSLISVFLGTFVLLGHLLGYILSLKWHKHPSCRFRM